jgi:flagellar assembly factor FliW
MYSAEIVLPDALTLPEGLIGLPEIRALTVQALEGTPFVSLETTDGGGYSAAAALADDIRPGITGTLVEAGTIRGGMLVLVLLAAHGDPPTVTANLAGPLILDPLTGVTTQLVLEGDGYPLRAPVGPG